MVGRSSISSRVSSTTRMRRCGGTAASTAPSIEVLPANGGPETTSDSRVCAIAHRKPAAGQVSEPRRTMLASDSLRSWWKRIVQESLSATGGMAADKRARPPRTRAWTMGFWVSRWRWVAASNRSMAWRFSSCVVGATSVWRRPLESTYITRSPSISISSIPGASNRPLSGPKLVIERTTRSATASTSPRPRRCAATGGSPPRCGGGWRPRWRGRPAGPRSSAARWRGSGRRRWGGSPGSPPPSGPARGAPAADPPAPAAARPGDRRDRQLRAKCLHGLLERAARHRVPVPDRLLDPLVGRYQVQRGRQEAAQHLALQLAALEDARGRLVEHHVQWLGPGEVAVVTEPHQQPREADRGGAGDHHELVGATQHGARDAVAGEPAGGGHLLDAGAGVDQHLGVGPGQLADHLGNRVGAQVRPVPRVGEPAQQLEAAVALGQRHQRLLVGVHQHGALAAAAEHPSQCQGDLGGAGAAGDGQRHRDQSARRLPCRPFARRRLGVAGQLVAELAGSTPSRLSVSRAWWSPAAWTAITRRSLRWSSAIMRGVSTLAVSSTTNTA